MSKLNGLSLITRDGIHPTAKYIKTDRAVRGATPFAKAHAALEARATSTTGTDHSVPDSAVSILDQLQLGSCVLNALAAMVMIVLAIEGQPFAPLSRLWLYWLCSKVMGTVGQDTGTEVSIAVERATSIGICDEASWPYTDDAAKFFVPPADVLADALTASDNRPTAWLKIDESSPTTKLTQFEAAIRADHCVQIGAPVDSTIQSYQAGDVLTLPDPNGIIGGHSWLICGVRYVNGKRQWKCRNSWGAGYGESGYFWIDEAYAADPDLSDCWVLTRIDPLEFASAA